MKTGNKNKCYSFNSPFEALIILISNRSKITASGWNFKIPGQN